MTDFKYTRITADTLKIKGILSEDGTKITFIKGKKGNEEEITVSLLDYLKEYAGQLVTFGIATKDELNLQDEE